MRQLLKYAAVCVLVLACLIAWHIFVQPKKDGFVNPALPADTAETPLPARSNVVAAQSNAITPDVRRVERAGKLQKMENAINTSIVFFGKIIDQYGNPVEGANVEAAYNGWNVSEILNQRPHRGTNNFYSSASGDFEIKGIRGSGIDLKIEKPGFRFDPQARKSFGFGYGTPEHYEPDPAHPVIYHAWKSQELVQLVTRSFEKKVRADGTPISLDLQNDGFVIGSTNNIGPTVRVWRDPLVFDYRTAPPKVWSYELTWPHGALNVTNDFFYFLAPDRGYSEKWERTIRQGDPDYRYQDKIEFYFINEQHQFGCGSLAIWADRRDDTALVILSVGWNPEGGRNLEPKP